MAACRAVRQATREWTRQKCMGHMAAAAQKIMHAMLLKAAAKAWSCRCIIDSGASYTYATPDVPLTNTRPGVGSVTVANGKRERIAEIGDLGPLKNVRRVMSFTRTLVSVRDLVDQFHRVVFDSRGVAVESETGDVRTLIGLPMRNRLYSFDGSALARHAALVTAH